MEKNEDQQKKQNLELEDDNYWKKLKRFKIATLLVIGLIGLALSVNIGVHATSTTSFCSSCHMMTPQALTWEASSHSSIGCKDCHINEGIQGKVEAKIGGLYELYHMVTDSYVTPIRMHSEIPNENCMRCHNMNNRDVSASGDIIIDHFVHEEKEIKCVTCHDGVGHGKVSEQRITHRTDFDRWSLDLAERIMSDPTNTRPQMDLCMDCHELKRAPLTCETCHTTGMYPEDHQQKDFLTNNHGALASEDLLYCESCHSYMSDTVIKEFREEAHYLQYINADQAERTITVQDYAKTNTFCIDCHSERPESHNDTKFYLNHGKLSEEKSDNCETCHDFNTRGASPVTNVTCATCHPSSHNNDRWRTRHPIPLGPEPKYDQSCLSCHVETTCSSCHISGNRISNRND